MDDQAGHVSWQWARFPSAECRVRNIEELEAEKAAAAATGLAHTNSMAARMNITRLPIVSMLTPLPAKDLI